MRIFLKNQIIFKLLLSPEFIIFKYCNIAPSNFYIMQEDFLHYIWKFQKFDLKGLKTTAGELLELITVGLHNTDAGPDFFNAQIAIAGQLWAGNVEIHIKSSDWYAHQHQKDASYDNVILHVVWEHDADIFRNDGAIIPTLKLKKLIAPYTLAKYRDLFSKSHKWINCENDFARVDEFLLKNWLESLFIERLEQKSEFILNELKTTNNHWEALLFRLLCKSFGSIVNGISFLSVARSLDFLVVNKCSQNQFDLESLFMGQAGLLSIEKEDGYYTNLKKNYEYLKHKYNLDASAIIFPKFFRLRPPNFPTIRLAQLASLYTHRKQIFSEIILDIPLNETDKTLKALYEIFDVSASEYWDNHYSFGVASVIRKKGVTKRFVDILIINTIIPLQFCYTKQMGKDSIEALINLASAINGEENTIVKKYKELRPIVTSVLDSQALLQLKNEYCSKMRCLECAVGNAVLRE